MSKKLHTSITSVILLIKEERLKKGYSQEYLATKLMISQPNYSKIEKGENRIYADQLIKLIVILELDWFEINNCYIKPSN